MRDANLRESMIVRGVENLLRKLIITLQIERLFGDFLFFHQIGIVFENPLDPSITVHD